MSDEGSGFTPSLAEHALDRFVRGGRPAPPEALASASPSSTRSCRPTAATWRSSPASQPRSLSVPRAAESGPLYINAFIYAEVSIRFTTIEDLEAALPPADFRRLQLPWNQRSLAGKAFPQYRRSTGTKRSPLLDFFIGAHAAVSSLALLTRDHRRYSSYFPSIRLIHP